MSLEDGNTLQGGYTVGMFHDVTSVGEFAATLEVWCTHKINSTH